MRSMTGNYHIVYVNDNNVSGHFASDTKLDAISDLNEIKDFCRAAHILEYSTGDIIKTYMKKDKKDLVNEGTVSGAIGADDGPSFMYPSHETYVRASTKDLQKYIETGWTIVSHMMDDDTEEDIMARIYPDGPVGSVSFFPAGDIDDLTPNNQENLFGSEAYEKWKKHTLDTLAKVGWEWIHTRGEDEDAEEAIEDAEDLEGEADEQKDKEEKWKDTIKESVNSLKESINMLKESEKEKLEEGRGDLLYLIDQLSNAMEYYDKQSFVSHISRETQYSKEKLRQIYDAYWDVPVKDKMKMNMKPGWEDWLKNNFDITEGKEKKNENVNEAASKAFSKAAEEYQRESVKLQKMKDDQKKLVDKFKNSDGKDKEKLKDALIKMHRQVKKQQSIVDKAESNFERAIRNEPEELEELLSSIKEGRWSQGFTKRSDYDDVKRNDIFDKWRMKMKDILDKGNLSRSAYDQWIEKIKNAQSSSDTKKITKGIKNIVEQVVNEGVVSKRQLVKWVNEFNNTSPGSFKNVGGNEYYVFAASDFAAEGIRKALSAFNMGDKLKYFRTNVWGIKLDRELAQSDFIQKRNEGTVNESVGVMKKDGNTLYVDTDFVQNSQKAGTLKHVSMGDFELRLDNGGTIQFDRASKSFPSFSGRAHRVKGSEDDIKKMLRKMPKGITQESVNEGIRDVIKKGLRYFRNTDTEGTKAISDEIYMKLRRKENPAIGKLSALGRTKKGHIRARYVDDDDRNHDFLYDPDKDMMASVGENWNESIKEFNVSHGVTGNFEEQIKSQIKARAESCGKKHLTDEDIDNWLKGMGNLNNYNEQQIENVKKAIKSVNSKMKESVNEKYTGTLRDKSVDIGVDSPRVKKALKNSGLSWRTTNDGVLVFATPGYADKAKKILNKNGVAASSKGGYVYIESVVKEAKKERKISKKEWDKLHRDFKGETDGQKYIVTRDKKSGGTIRVPVTVESVVNEDKFTVSYAGDKEEIEAKDSSKARQKFIEKNKIPMTKWKKVTVESINEGDSIFSKLRKGNPNKGGNMRDDVKKVLDKVTKAYRVEDDGVLRFSSVKDARKAYQELNRAGIAASPSFESSKNRFYVYLESKQFDKLKEIFTESINEAVQPSDTIKKVQDVVKNRQAEKIDGFYMDLTTANFVNQMYDQVNDSQKKKLNNLSADKLAKLAYKVMK